MRSDRDRARALSRMRVLATGLLALMVMVFIAASFGERRWPLLAYVRAFAEAGAVGACADWFAVTALFRRPLGLPIPHTGIIPRNKDRIGEALGAFIAENFLTETVLDQRLRALEVARWGGSWLAQPQNARRVARRIGALAPEVLDALPEGALFEPARAAALSVAAATPAAPFASKLLAAFWRHGAGQAVLDGAIVWLGDVLVEHQPALRDDLAQKAHTWLPRWIDRMLAASAVDGAIRLLKDMRDPAHPWRRELAAWIEQTIERLGHDPVLRIRGEQLKRRLLADDRLLAQIDPLWETLERRLKSAAAAADFAARLEPALLALGDWLYQNDAAQVRLNTWARLLARKVIAPRRHEIGVFVAQVVAGWDAKSVTEKLELQVGRDLQYIRINGTVVGGLVGLAIFALARVFSLG